MKLKTRIVKNLQKLGQFDLESDEILINELVFNIEIAQHARKEIRAGGIIIKGRFDVDIRNPALDVYNAAVKNINALSTKIGMSRQERLKLKLALEQKDAFDEAFK